PLDRGGQLRRASGARPPATRVQTLHPVAAEAGLPSGEKPAGGAPPRPGPPPPPLRSPTKDPHPPPLFALLPGPPLRLPQTGFLGRFPLWDRWGRWPSFLVG